MALGAMLASARTQTATLSHGKIHGIALLNSDTISPAVSARLTKKRAELDAEIEAFREAKEIEYRVFERSLLEPAGQTSHESSRESTANAEARSAGEVTTTNGTTNNGANRSNSHATPQLHRKKKSPLPQEQDELRALFNPSFLPLLEAPKGGVSERAASTITNEELAGVGTNVQSSTALKSRHRDVVSTALAASKSHSPGEPITTQQDSNHQQQTQDKQQLPASPDPPTTSLPSYTLSSSVYRSSSPPSTPSAAPVPLLSNPAPTTDSLTSRSPHSDTTITSMRTISSSAPRPSLVEHHRRSSSRSDPSVPQLRSSLRQPRSPADEEARQRNGGSLAQGKTKHVLFEIDGGIISPSSSPVVERHASRLANGSTTSETAPDHTLGRNRKRPAATPPARHKQGDRADYFSSISSTASPASRAAAPTAGASTGTSTSGAAKRRSAPPDFYAHINAADFNIVSGIKPSFSSSLQSQQRHVSAPLPDAVPSTTLLTPPISTTPTTPLTPPASAQTEMSRSYAMLDTSPKLHDLELDEEFDAPGTGDPMFDFDYDAGAGVGEGGEGAGGSGSGSGSGSGNTSNGRDIAGAAAPSSKTTSSSKAKVKAKDKERVKVKEKREDSGGGGNEKKAGRKKEATSKATTSTSKATTTESTRATASAAPTTSTTPAASAAMPGTTITTDWAEQHSRPMPTSRLSDTPDGARRGEDHAEAQGHSSASRTRSSAGVQASSSLPIEIRWPGRRLS